MKRKRSAVLMIAGVLLIVGALGLAMSNLYEEQRGEAYARQISNVLEERVIAPVAVTETSQADVKTMQTVCLEGQEYIGVIEIPSLSLELPIQKECSDAQLKASPCRYSGSFLNDSMILAGHNYKKHFGSLSALQRGDEVVFTDVTGQIYYYAVMEITSLDAYDTEEMQSGDWDLTLFTCNFDGQKRITVRCERLVRG
ncbi:sortase [Anaeromassilibacillus senegalensis]|uniref:sortase n=1 Tax=Anaeromassilibacillus senegalensis TaxID=1673717 RepID=UPI0006824EAF|nr:sortase [Anaeromassilibacillus senegalensis]